MQDRRNGYCCRTKECNNQSCKNFVKLLMSAGLMSVYFVVHEFASGAQADLIMEAVFLEIEQILTAAWLKNGGKTSPYVIGWI